jgi:hypothetical protein
MALPVCPAGLRCVLRGFGIIPRRLVLSIAMMLSMAASASAGDAVAVALNDATTVSGTCHASFIVRNDLPHTLDRFQLDLYVLDSDGVIKSRSNVDLAPLINGKNTMFAFRIYAEPCAAVSKIIVNDIPKCRAETGAKLDCMNGLTVSSRNRIEFAK